MRSFLLSLVFLMVSFSSFAFEGLSDGTSLKIFNRLNCGAGLTCTRSKNGVFNVVSSPTLDAGDITIAGIEAGDAVLTLNADQADDNGDSWAVSSVASGNAFTVANNTSGSLVNKLTLSTGGNLVVTGNVTGVAGVFSGAVSGTTGTFTGAVAGTSGTFTGAILGDGGDALSGFRQKQVAATATTITAAQCGSTFINTGAVQMELPEASAVLGCRLTFITGNAANFDVNPDDADIIVLLANAAGDAIRNATVGNSVTIEAISASQWAQVSTIGTWSDIN